MAQALSTDYYGARCKLMAWPVSSTLLCRAQVRAIEEEEYCLIPMGGVLPTHPQRVLGIGGTAGEWHACLMQRLCCSGDGLAGLCLHLV
jgi:hypothetical protein